MALYYQAEDKIMTIEPSDLNRELVNKLSMDNPVVYHFLTAHAGGWLTYEQALIGIVNTLVSHNNELINLNIERIESSKVPYHKIILT